MPSSWFAVKGTRIVTRVVNYFTRVPQSPEMPTFRLRTRVQPRGAWNAPANESGCRVYQPTARMFEMSNSTVRGSRCISDQRNERGHHDPCPSSSSAPLLSSSMFLHRRLHRALVRFSTHRLPRTSWPPGCTLSREKERETDK